MEAPLFSFQEEEGDKVSTDEQINDIQANVREDDIQLEQVLGAIKYVKRRNGSGHNKIKPKMLTEEIKE